jgi:hypothetical protein
MRERRYHMSFAFLHVTSSRHEKHVREEHPLDLQLILFLPKAGVVANPNEDQYPPTRNLSG